VRAASPKSDVLEDEDAILHLALEVHSEVSEHLDEAQQEAGDSIAMPDASAVAYLDSFCFEGLAGAPPPLAFPANSNAPLPSQRRPPAVPLKSTAALPKCSLQQKAATGSKDMLEDFDAMPQAERESIARKWWGFVEDGSSAESARLQLLIAAILHAKANEAAVCYSLRQLRTWARQKEASMSDDAGGLTVERLAGADVEELIQPLSGVHWHRSKAGRVISAAKMLVESFGGCIPTDRSSLLRLPGLGQKLTNILAFLFGVDQLAVVRRVSENEAS
jgi:endonuclease III